MKQIIYLGGKKARNYTAPHEETDVIGDCDWKEGEVKTKGVDYEIEKQGQMLTGEWLADNYLDENDYHAIVQAVRTVIVPIPKKQEGDEQLWNEVTNAIYGKSIGLQYRDIQSAIVCLKEKFTITRKS